MQLHISIKLSASSEYSLDLSLCDKISPQDTAVSFLSTKVEVRLKKANEGTKWTALERPANADIIVTKWDDSSNVNKHLYPTSSKIKKNWDSIVKNVCVFLPFSSSFSFCLLFLVLGERGCVSATDDLNMIRNTMLIIP